MSGKRSRFSLFVALGILLSALPALGQTPTAEITGVVRDVGGAPVADATVTATNTATRVSKSATTGPDGRFTISGLDPGTYTLTTSHFGFRSAERTVELTQGARLTVELAVEPVLVEGVTVTAMLREEQLMDVPFSIAAPTAEELRARGAEDIEAVAVNVAGFSVQNLGPGQSQVAMRSASSGQIARDQPGVKEQVGVYLDDVPVSLSLYTPDVDLFDISRVEVLRGPQGTLFGAGSLAGTVRYITNEPELGVRSVFGEVGGNLIDGGNGGGNVKLGVNVPLGDRVAARLVGYYNRVAGYMDAVMPVMQNDTIGGFFRDDDVNTGNRIGGRAALRIAPDERWSITPRVLFQRVEMDGWNRIDDFNILGNPFTTTNPPVELDERELVLQFEEPYTDDFLLTDLNLRYDFGPVGGLGPLSVTSITAFMYRDILVVRDAGALTSSITGGSVGLPENIYTIPSPLDDATETRVFTQELRLAGGEERLRWLVGGFYTNNQRDYGQSLLVQGFDELAAPILGAPEGFTEGLRAARDELFFSDLSYDLEQFAVFGEATFSATDRLDLTAGLRYYNFNEERDQVFDGIFVHEDLGNTVVSQPGEIEADGLAPRFIASFQASDDVRLNAQASRGFRLGGINDPLNLPLCSAEDSATFGNRPTWEDETAWNYEVGAKSRLAGGRATVNVSAFFLDIREIQVTTTGGTCSSRIIFNVPEARSMGVEAEVTASPNENLDFSIAAALNDSELRSTILSAGQPVAGMAAGNRLPSVPQVEVSAAATYGWPVGRDARAFITGSYQHVGSRFTAIDDHGSPGEPICPPDQPDCPLGVVNLDAFGDNALGGPLTQSVFRFDPELPAYNLVNARVGLIRGAWEIALFARNLTDERAFLALDRERGTLARVGYLTNQPRTFGISARFAY